MARKGRAELHIYKTSPACFRVAPMPLHDADRLQNTGRLNSRPGQLATPVISNRVVHDINGRSQTSERVSICLILEKTANWG